MSIMTKTVRWGLCASIGLLVSVSVSALARADQLAEAIDRAEQASVGLLPFEEESLSEAAKSHFSVRGSGFYIGDGYVVTARHAVERQHAGQADIPERILVLTTQLEEVGARLVGVDRFLDVAVYRLDETETALSLRDVEFSAEEPASGDEVFTVGYPLGWGPAITFGRVGNTMTFLPTAHSRLVQLDMSVCHGNSGGGLFDAAGKVIGLMHAIIQTESVQSERRCSRLGFAVPGPLVKSMVSALIQGQHPKFPRLGIRMTAVKVGVQWRVAVAEVTGPARAAGLRKGDVLLAIDGIDIRSAAQFKSHLLERTKPGQRIALSIRRGDVERVVVVTLGGL